MRILMCALIGLIIFVSQPGTVIVVGDLPLQDAENYNHAATTALFTGGAVDFPFEKLVLLGNQLNVPMRLDTARLRSVGPTRGPVK